LDGKKQGFVPEHIDAHSPTIADFVRAGRPAILEGGLERWHTDGASSLSWFRQHYGELTSDVYFDRAKRTMTLGAYVDRLLASERVETCGYMAQVHIAKFPGYEQIAHFPFCWMPALTNRSVWIGPGGAKTRLHCDFPDNLVAMPVGSKEFLLYAPETRRRIPLGPKSHVSWNSTRTLDDPPLADPDYEFVLATDDILYIPSGWWHEVTSLEPSVLVSQFWWRPKTLARQSLPFLLSRAFPQRVRGFLRKRLGLGTRGTTGNASSHRRTKDDRDVRRGA
jgi:cupin-like protein